MSFRAPIEEISLAMNSAGQLGRLIEDGFTADVDADLVDAVLAEAAKFAEEELAPLNTIGDQQGTKLQTDGIVTTPDAWKAMYAKWLEAGWAGLPCTPDYGGQGLPAVVGTAISEIWSSANLAFALGPLLNQGAVEAILIGGSDELKSAYLPKLVSGEWMGTMNLTEAHAGSDLGLLRTRAESRPDGTYLISGTKIFISYGEHDLTDNIVHLVLARLADAPPGTAGLSLFLVPKFLVNADSSLGARNDVLCTGVEHKLGIHASATCVMTYGENGGAEGYLLGQENRGLHVMFIMMNAARLGVGTQGVAIAERATQAAIAYAGERRQGRTIGTPASETSLIAEHPDVRRNLMIMKSMTAAARSICYATAYELDVAKGASDKDRATQAGQRAALLTPVAKAFSTDTGVLVSSVGIQVHGGMGYIEETGAAQHFRDARILPIYEGTNGIQAIDLVTRKLPLEGGEVVADYLRELGQTASDLPDCGIDELSSRAGIFAHAVTVLSEATKAIAAQMEQDPNVGLAGATPYLQLFGTVSGGIYLARAAILATQRNQGSPARPVALASFFADNFLTGVNADSVARSGAAFGAIPDDMFTG